MINSSEVEDQGFKPLKRAPTEPQSLPSKPSMSRGMSFNAETGEKESAQELWNGSSWVKMNRARGMTMDRSNTFVGAPIPEEVTLKDEVIAIVDPFSTGAHLAAEVCKQGYRCARVFSVWDSPVAALVQKGLKIDFCATIQFNDRNPDHDAAVIEAINALKDLPFPIRAVIPGAETGVELADQLSHRMGLRSNGVAKSLARRNKYHMGENVRAAGVRAVTQAMCVNEEQVSAFIRTLPGKDARCVVKPVQSAGSDDVFLCANEEEALTAFNRINGTINGIGLQNTCVLVQEYLKGKEYVVDKVSRDGVHKLVGIWEYEKRSVNGANFVYFGMRLMDPNSEKMQCMVRYADKVLDALDIKHGPSHMEVMLDNWGTVQEPQWVPCLVEVGARCQGGEGTWLPMAKECIGYTPVEVTLDVYLEGHLWKSLNKDSYPKRKAARECDMVSRNGGIIRKLIGDAFIRSLPSFRSVTWDVKPGDYISKTIDCFTRPGCVQLVADTEEQVEHDFEALHDHEELGLIDYSVICPTPPAIGAVVVVDPFSSGANIAAMVLLWGYKLILVFSEKDSPVANLVTRGSKVEPTLLVQHDSANPNQVEALKQTLASITGQGSPVLAIIPGAETGVELADRLASTYGTRCNPPAMSEVRRNKFKMQEALAAQGKIRTVQQALCRTEKEVTDFMTKLLRAGCTTCVLKPNQSAGTDNVHLCETAEQAVAAFHAVHGQINGLGQINDGVLVQECLQGTEYAVDGVSRDGVYKVLAVWEYDKRSVNGANFVYFGMTLRDPSDPKVRTVVEYAREVIKGLRIFQGPSHMEVICETQGGNVNSEGLSANRQYSPCLVEVGTRCHGGEATWLPVAMECIGYSQLDATLNCYLRPDRFDALPFEPTLHKQGCEAFLVSLVEGTLKDIPGMETIRNLPSFRRTEMLTQPGAKLRPTVDCFTRPGSVQLVNHSKEQLLADYQAIRALEKGDLFSLV